MVRHTLKIYQFYQLHLIRTNEKTLKNFMTPFYGWDSTASRLELLRGGSLLLPLSSKKFLILILSTSEG